MHFARAVPPRTTKATVRFGSSLSPPVTSLAAALTAALVAEPASRPAGKQQPCCTSKSPRFTAEGFFICVTRDPNRKCSGGKKSESESTVCPEHFRLGGL